MLVLPMRLLLQAIIIFWPSFRRSKKIRLGTVVEHIFHICLEFFANFEVNNVYDVLKLKDCASGTVQCSGACFY